MNGVAGALPPPLAACRLTVAIPARDEAGSLPRALAALAVQRQPDGTPLRPGSFDVVVFANGCRDETAALARRVARERPGLTLSVVEGELPPGTAHVGTARRWIMDAAAERFTRAGRPGAVVATTDADTVVDPCWVAWTLREIEPVEAVAGRVTLAAPERDALHAPQRVLYLRERAYRRTLAELEAVVDPLPYDPAPRHASFVGASFAVRADAYRAAGGVPPEPALEDRRFFLALRRIDARVRHSLCVRAATSARRDARVADGFGRFLAHLDACGRRGASFAVEDPRKSIAEMTLRAALRRSWRGSQQAGDAALVTRLLGARPGEWLPLLDASAPFGLGYERVAQRFCGGRDYRPVAVEDATAALRRALSALKAAAPVRARTASGAG